MTEDLHEDLPLLDKSDKFKEAAGDEDVFEHISKNDHPEDADNRLADKWWFAMFAILVLVVLGSGFTAIFLGKVNAVLIGVDKVGFICGNRGSALSSYGFNGQGDVTWSKFMEFSAAPDETTTRSCVDSCPRKSSWQCSTNNLNLTCSKQQAPKIDYDERSTFGYCIRPSDVGQLLNWMMRQLSPRQFALVISYWNVLTILITVFTVTVVANFMLFLLLFAIRISWKIWTAVIIFIYALAIVSTGVDLRFNTSFENGTVSNAYVVDAAVTWSLFLLLTAFVTPVIAILWAAVLRSESLCFPILQSITQHMLITRTTLARLQVFTFVNSLVTTVFQFCMFLLIYFVGSLVDATFNVGIFAPSSLVKDHLIVTVLVSTWTVLWVLVAETVVASNYLGTCSHMWNQFYERNFYFSDQPYHEHLCDCRSCVSTSQLGIAFHGAILLFSRLGRIFYFACTTLCFGRHRWPIASRLSEAIYSVAGYYCGIGFSKSVEILSQLTDVSSVDDSADTYTVVSTATRRSVRYSASSKKSGKLHKSSSQLKLEMCEKNLKDVQGEISELEKKIAELAALEEEQKRKKTQIKVVRDLASLKEQKLSEKEAQVQYVLNTLLKEFEKTKGELMESLDRQRIFEIKKMTNPPPAVKLTIEAVACLLGHKDMDWPTLRVFIVKDSFMPSLMRLDAETVSVELCRTVRKKYFDSNDSFTFEKVNRASKTCGILYRWLDALSNFAIERERIRPLLDEVDVLAAELERLRAEDAELGNQVAQQDAMIAGIRLQMNLLEKKLEKKKVDEDNLSLEKMQVEKLVEEPDEPTEPAEPVITIEQRDSEIDAIQAIQEKIKIQSRLNHFIWTMSCFCYVITVTMCAASLPIARLIFIAFEGTASSIAPVFHAIPLMLIFCLLFTISSSVFATYESAMHTCAVAGLLHLSKQHSGPISKILDSKSTNQRLPKSIDSFVISVLKFDDGNEEPYSDMS